MSSRPASHRHFEPALVFVAALALPAYLALRGGGFDVVERHEAALAVWWMLALGLVFGLVPAARPSRSVAGALVALFLLTVWTAVSLTWTESDERTFVELNRTLDYAAVPALVWFSVGRHSWRAAAAGLMAAAASITLVAVAARVAPDLLPPDTVAQQFGGERLSYPLDYWNATAYWGAATLAAGVAWSSHSSSLGVRALLLGVTPIAGVSVYLSYSRGGALIGLFALVATVAASRRRRESLLHAATAVMATGAVCAVVATQSEIANGTGGRGGALVLVALIAACLLTMKVAVRTGTKKLKRRRVGAAKVRQPQVEEEQTAPAGRLPARRILVGVVLAAFAIGGAALASSLDDRLSRAAYDPGSGHPGSRFLSVSDGRGELYASAIDEFEADPLHGTGPGTFELWHDRSGRGVDQVQDAHSLYLESLGELGAPGLGLVLAGVLAIGLLAARSTRRLRNRDAYGAGLAMSVIFAVVFAGSAIDWLWEVPALTVLALSAGAVASASLGAPRHRRRTTAIRLLVAVVAILGGLLHIPSIVSTERIKAAEFQLALGHEPEALKLADDAVSAAPWSASARAARAFVEIRSGDFQAASVDSAEAIRLEPTNWRHRELQLRISFLRGDPASMNEALQQLERLRPGPGAAP